MAATDVAPAAVTAAPVATAIDVEPVVLYDGVCGLCSKSVSWILGHERTKDLRFAPLQGPTAAALRTRYPRIPAELSSVVYITGGRVHLRSKAFLHVAQHLRRPWKWAYYFRWFPGFLLDLPYRLVARLRYRIWGKHDECKIPAPDQRARFLD
jgi:predicted DCC family thiol-disulfide oxidoreductase YuxK